MNTNKKKTKDFHFKQFSIYGGLSGMPVSTDGVLLGGWSRFFGCNKILDIGTGTGLLALMCAQRFPQAQITAIDIDQQAAKAADYNFRQSPWSEKLSVIHADINDVAITEMFDGIICNPPYFTSGIPAQQPRRAIARHTHSLSHTSLLNKCKEFITDDGGANFVLPLTEGKAFIRAAQDSGWHLTRLCRVRPTANKAAHRLLIELSKQNTGYAEEELIVHNKQGYSEAFILLTKDFYLKM
ncbi:tRNA (adenosine(37)-N6)-methyltransferase TrmM [Vibrio albus]|uniref:tRNA1(Val) (adenine(37)-N6)-methyltransferase n=1 Tax=Vibrio albus TaxID=2200953 RepID=A0A2U3B5N0_9VIBR|nr:tRNA1(Val) (adenine(37)-N6)-methyltransferase [Vibrio albus]PWI32087.1 tRNA (adenosine(37)-N6)-methyltransferase TrmM [Vibrio albus]